MSKYHDLVRVKKEVTLAGEVRRPDRPNGTFPAHLLEDWQYEAAQEGLYGDSFELVAGEVDNEPQVANMPIALGRDHNGDMIYKSQHSAETWTVSADAVPDFSVVSESLQARMGGVLGSVSRKELEEDPDAGEKHVLQQFRQLAVEQRKALLNEQKARLEALRAELEALEQADSEAGDAEDVPELEFPGDGVSTDVTEEPATESPATSSAAGRKNRKSSRIATSEVQGQQSDEDPAEAPPHAEGVERDTSGTAEE